MPGVWTGGVERSMFVAVQFGKSMRFLSIFLIAFVTSTLSLVAATPEVGPTSTVPAAAAEQGKDVVHQLNNGFAKVFETVSPRVVTIEVLNTNDGDNAASEA